MCDYDASFMEDDLYELEAQERFKAEYDAALAKHPHACEHCGGTGRNYLPGSYDCPPDEEPCEFCVLEDTCPVCGDTGLNFVEGKDPKSGLPNDHFECPHCGYNELTAEPVLPEF
jgi:hypothetical protein